MSNSLYFYEGYGDHWALGPERSLIVMIVHCFQVIFNLSLPVPRWCRKTPLL